MVGVSQRSESSSVPVVDTDPRMGSKRQSQVPDTEGEVDRTAEAVAETTTALAAAEETVTALETAIDAALAHRDFPKLPSLSVSSFRCGP